MDFAGDGNIDGTNGRCFGAKHAGGAAGGGRVGVGEERGEGESSEEGASLNN